MTVREEDLGGNCAHGASAKFRTVLRPTGPASEYVVVRNGVGLRPAAAADCPEKWVANKGARLFGMPFEVQGLSWLLVLGLEPSNWRSRETDGEAEAAEVSRGCWVPMKGTAPGLSGDLLRKLSESEKQLDPESPTMWLRCMSQGSDEDAGASPMGPPVMLPKAKEGDASPAFIHRISSSTEASTPSSSSHSPEENPGDPSKVVLGSEIRVYVPGKGNQRLEDALKSVLPRLESLWCTIVREGQAELSEYRGHFNAIVFFLLGVQKAPFTNGAQKSLQAMYNSLARPNTGALDHMLVFCQSSNKDGDVPHFRETMNDCIQEILATLINLTAFVDGPAKAKAQAALADVEASAAAVSYGLPTVPEEERCSVILSRIGSDNTRKITVSRHTSAGALRNMLVENLGFPSSIRLLGSREQDSADLHPLPPGEPLVEGGTITVHGAITLHPGATETDPRERTQAEFEWAFLGNVPRVSIVQAISMFQELKEGFAAPAFQEKLSKMHQEYLVKKDTSMAAKIMQGVAELAYEVQSRVVAKYGYPSTPAGVKAMRAETADIYNRDERLHDLSRECQDLLSFTVQSPSTDVEKPPPVISCVHSRRFHLQDVHNWKEHLSVHGYVVISKILTEAQRQQAMDLLWCFLEATDGNNQVNRDDVSSWQDSKTPGCGWPARKEDGLIKTRGIGQSSFLWYLRGLPQVKEVFASIWGTDSLVTSFDGACAFRPYSWEPSWKTKRQNWYHVDQAHGKRGLHCVQGAVTLTPANEGRGGLVVVPGSHRFHSEVLRKYNASETNYLQLKAWDPIIREGGGPILVGAEAGDLILWDSRTIHCNTAPLQEDPCQRGDELIRAAAFVCMTPARWSTQATLIARRHAADNWVTCTHWPHEFFVVDGPTESGVMKESIAMPQVQLSDAQKELVAPQKLLAANGLKDRSQVVKPGQKSLAGERPFRAVRDKVSLWSAPYELSSPVRIGTVEQWQVVNGHSFGEWIQLSPKSVKEVMVSEGMERRDSIGEIEAWARAVDVLG